MGLIKPDFYEGQPLKWLGNQWTHFFMGVGSVVVVCFLAYFIQGEWPYKAIAALTCILGYLLVIEFLFQGWQKVDTLDDTCFFSYGALIPLLMLSEDAGSSLGLYAESPLWGVAALALIFLHAGAGYIWRAINQV